MNNMHNAKKLPKCERHLSEQVYYNGTESKSACDLNCQNPFLLSHSSSTKAGKPDSGTNSVQHIRLQKLLWELYAGTETGLLVARKRKREKKIHKGTICVLCFPVIGMSLSLLAFIRAFRFKLMTSPISVREFKWLEVKIRLDVWQRGLQILVKCFILQRPPTLINYNKVVILPCPLSLSSSIRAKK